MKNKTGILVFVAILVITTVAIYIWGSNLLKGVEEEETKSNTLAPQIRSLFSTMNAIDEYPLQPGKPDWQGKYLIVENNQSDSMNARYSTKWNELLGADKNFPGNDVKGVVMIALYTVIEGSFERVLGIPSDTKAVRQSYIISYLDIAQKSVLARDTLIGADPPTVIRRGESGWGDPPAEDLVVETIKKRLN